MKKLQLSLIEKWFEMTKKGIKPEDYRELTSYWYARLCLYDGVKKSKRFWDFIGINNVSADSSKLSFIKFENNVMTKGYPKSTDTERILKLEHKGIGIGTGNPEYGAVEGKLYFVIKHGKIID